MSKLFCRSKLFWSGPNHFGQVRIRLFWTDFYNLDLSKMINLDPTKTNWTKTSWTQPKLFGRSKIILDPQKDKALKKCRSLNNKKLCFLLIIQKRIFHALSYGSKMILDRPNCFGWVQIVLVGSNSFWSGPNHFGQVQIIKISPEKSNLNLTKIIWIRPKQFGLDQKNL